MDSETILSEVVALDIGEELQPGEFTVGDYCDEYFATTGKRLSRTTALSRLNKLVREGVLESRLARYGTTYAYRKATDD